MSVARAASQSAAAGATVRSLADFSTDDRRNVPVSQHAARSATLDGRRSPPVSAAVLHRHTLPAFGVVVGRCRLDALTQRLGRHKAVRRADTT